MATQRTADFIFGTGCFSGKSVLDMGCGDGFFTIKVFNQGKPKSKVGVDAAFQAILAANSHKANHQIDFISEMHTIYPGKIITLT